jgi:hypothetical protein
VAAEATYFIGGIGMGVVPIAAPIGGIGIGVVPIPTVIGGIGIGVVPIPTTFFRIVTLPSTTNNASKNAKKKFFTAFLHLVNKMAVWRQAYSITYSKSTRFYTLRAGVAF